MTKFFKELSDEMATIVEEIGQSMVRVDARRRVSATGIIWSATGVIVTCHHSVQQEDAIRVGLPDGDKVTATLIGRDPTTDLAVLQAEADGLTPPPWTDFQTEEIKVGQLVLALGRPGYTPQATSGIVSALAGNWRTPSGGVLEHYLQTDVTMYPGFSGGPLVGANRTVLGLNSSALRLGVSLTISAPTIKRVVETLFSHGRIQRGYLGVSTQQVRLPQTMAQQLNQKTALLLVRVEPDSPADKGGLLLGDTLINIADTSIQKHDDLLAWLSSSKRVKETTSIKIIRGGEIQEKSITIGERR